LKEAKGDYGPLQEESTPTESDDNLSRRKVGV